MTIVPFSQTANKHVRIFTHSADVQNMIYFPVGWETKWAKFASAIKSYRKEGRNAHDDAPDVLTGMIEKFRTNKPMSEIDENMYDDVLY